jgi:hypothetical protein
MKALLVRVGIDKKSGEWNAPVHPSTNEFVYVPIPEGEGKEVYPEYKRTYEEFKKPCEKLGSPLPPKVIEEYTSVHLDPDFCSLTYGDIDETNGKNHRGRPLLNLQEDDLLVFYAGLDPGRWKDTTIELVYAIIGLYVIKEKPRRATEIPNIDKYRDKNAHTRRDYNEADIIVSAKPAPLSGRLERCIPIGERRSNGHYYLKQCLFDEWGGFLHKNILWLQRSPTLPRFSNPEKFYKWFKNQPIQLVASNNSMLCSNHKFLRSGEKTHD